jgi:hypothetical protein
VPLLRLYTDEFAGYWPLMSPPEQYAREAEICRDALRRRLGPGRHDVLELGVGGGHNMSHLTGDFRFTAVDLSPAIGSAGSPRGTRFPDGPAGHHQSPTPHRSSRPVNAVMSDRSLRRSTE